jgi:hypothetical protein
MAWDFIRVLMSNSEEIYTSTGELVVLDAFQVPDGGGGGLTDLGKPKVHALRFRIEYDVDGIKALATKDLFSIFGKVSEEILKLITLIGIVKQLQSKETIIEGISSYVIEGQLKLTGTLSTDLKLFLDILGTKSQTIKDFVDVEGITREEVKSFLDIIGKISNEVSLSQEIQGIKDIAAILKLDIIGTKNFLDQYEYFTKGKKDIRELIIAVMNLE